ncbi:hypothetical protein VB774_04175 [Pseudanabaena galeata UHCC 0370]|uniref:Uncharacterized protein n=1 Tax=Pseudanabaena galeata UHCC 0370 TaxID=3110310 RepID=A0ABU5TEZ1_9CYAN|nr:hypothetical protein [Pseudanabaena galeata]MEA5476810.1 hypothetical protein [Pseudanabaena galeata UHCC 0370]
MTLQELQKQVLLLPISDRWLLVQTLLESLKRECQPIVKRTLFLPNISLERNIFNRIHPFVRL